MEIGGVPALRNEIADEGAGGAGVFEVGLEETGR